MQNLPNGAQDALKNLQQQAAERQKICCRAQRDLQKEAKAEHALSRIEREKTSANSPSAKPAAPGRTLRSARSRSYSAASRTPSNAASAACSA